MTIIDEWNKLVQQDSIDYDYLMFRLKYFASIRKELSEDFKKKIESDLIRLNIIPCTVEELYRHPEKYEEYFEKEDNDNSSAVIYLSYLKYGTATPTLGLLCNWYPC